MAKSPTDHLTEAKRIAARMLAMPPAPHNGSKSHEGKPGVEKSAGHKKAKTKKRDAPSGRRR